MKVRHLHDLHCVPLSTPYSASLGPVLRRIWGARLGLLAVMLSKSATFAAGPEIVLEQPAGTPLGGVSAWGDNTFGQTSVPAAAKSGVAAISAGDFHTVALKTDGTVIAWGRGSEGQTDVPAGLSSVKAIAAGYDHTAALKMDGTIVAWGSNGNGQTTVPAAARSGMASIAAGLNRTMAIGQDGTLIAWGRDDHGQTTIPSEAQTGVVAVAGGDAHTVALKNDGSVVAWGWNIHGITSVPEAAASDVRAIAAGDFHTVALKNDGSLLAWGRSFEGQTDVPAGLTGVQAVAAGSYHNVALKNDGTVVAWGRSSEGQTDVPAGMSGVVSVAAGFAHTVALRNSTVAFDAQITSASSAAKTFTIKNTGDASLHIASIGVIGGNADDFSVSSAAALQDVAASAGTTTFTVAFHPTAPGLRLATLRVVSDDPGNGAFDVALSGIGVAGKGEEPPLSLPDVVAYLGGGKPIYIDARADGTAARNITILTQPQSGTASVVGGKIRFVPRTGQLNVPASFTCQMDDAAGRAVTRTIHIETFAAIAGAYDGLVEASPESTAAERHRESGHLRLAMSRTGAFTAAFRLGGATISGSARSAPIVGALDVSGNFSRTIRRAGQSPLTLTLHFDADTHTFSGNAASLDPNAPVASEMTLAPRTAASAEAGRYALQIESGETSAALASPGAARMRIARSGNVVIAGRLADGAPFSTVAFLHPDHAFSLYAVLYSGGTATRGSLRGIVPLPSENARALAATPALDWFKPTRPHDKILPQGIAATVVPVFP